jgi:membrane-bound lytic murein transglycosylase A
MVREGALAPLLVAGLAVTIVHVSLVRGKTVDDEVVSFAPVSFKALDGWQEDDHRPSFQALLRSCRKALGASGSGAAADVAQSCSAAIALGDRIGRDEARNFFEMHYTPHGIEGASAPGFVTGYYEPELDGARARGGRFQFPIYGRPDDLVALTPDLQRARFNDRLSAARETAEGRVPYYTRAEIEKGALSGAGLELLYLDDPVELFFMQVQGSGLVRLTDGTKTRLSYAGKNGHPYTSIGKLLIERGEIAADAMSMAAVKVWLRADSERARKLLWENRSYVFFRELTNAEAEGGPVGAEGVALTPGRSLAVDASYHALGLPVFVAAPGLRAPEGLPFRRLMIAQDVGSAIRGPERGDIFWGTGEAAGAKAGNTPHAAQIFVLLPKRRASASR